MDWLKQEAQIHEATFGKPAISGVNFQPQDTQSSSSDFVPNRSKFEGFDHGGIEAAESFVPKGKMAITEELFPDLDEDVGPRKKNRKKKIFKQKPIVKVVDMTTPFKGKPSRFFDMEVGDTLQNDPNNPQNYILNQLIALH